MSRKTLLSNMRQKKSAMGNKNCKPPVKEAKHPIVRMKQGLSYEEAIRILADTADSEVFQNCGPDHATLVMANIFRTSQEYVNIFAGDLNGTVSKGVYIEQLEKFLKRGGKVNLILQSQPPVDSVAYKLLSDYKENNPNQVDITVLNANNPMSKQQVHFTTGDDRMYRLETDTDTFTATGSFNDVAITGVLQSIFSKITDISN